MEQSILTTVKKAVNVAADDPSFDIDIIIAINAQFSTLTDLGVGPEIGFVIEDDTAQWSDYLDIEESPEKRIFLSKVKMAVILKTRLLFDPPVQSFLIASIEKQLAELEWRLNVNHESEAWTDPIPSEAMVIDGGDPSGG
jgi:hypothetical protein